MRTVLTALLTVLVLVVGGYALICVLLSVIGLIMTSTAFTLHSMRGLLINLLKTQWRK